MLLLTFIFWVTVLYEGGNEVEWKTWGGYVDFDNGENAFRLGVLQISLVIVWTFVLLFSFGGCGIFCSQFGEIVWVTLHVLWSTFLSAWKVLIVFISSFGYRAHCCRQRLMCMPTSRLYGLCNLHFYLFACEFALVHRVISMHMYLLVLSIPACCFIPMPMIPNLRDAAMAGIHTAKNSVCWSYLFPRYGGCSNVLNFSV